MPMPTPTPAAQTLMSHLQPNLYLIIMGVVWIILLALIIGLSLYQHRVNVQLRHELPQLPMPQPRETDTD